MRSVEGCRKHCVKGNPFIVFQPILTSIVDRMADCVHELLAFIGTRTVMALQMGQRQRL